MKKSIVAIVILIVVVGVILYWKPVTAPANIAEQNLSAVDSSVNIEGDLDKVNLVEPDAGFDALNSDINSL